jgi:type VI secretion system Hcp family effector
MATTSGANCTNWGDITRRDSRRVDPTGALLTGGTMTQRGYLRLEAQVLGRIKGASTAPGHEDTIPVLSFEHQLTTPIDPSTLLPTGKAVHDLMTITKGIDSSSTQLLKVFDEELKITRWEMALVRPDSPGRLEHHFTIELQDAWLTSLRSSQEEGQSAPLERVSFAALTIIWKDHSAGTEWHSKGILRA